MIENYKNLYQRFLKRKVTITTATVVAMLLGSAFAMGEENSNVRANPIWGVLISGDGVGTAENPYINEESSDGLTGMTIRGSNHNIINNGNFNGLVGISMNASGVSLENSGEIIATTGISISGNDNKVENKKNIIGLNGIKSSGKNEIINSGMMVSASLIGLGDGAIISNGDGSIIKNGANGIILAAGIGSGGNTGISSTGNSTVITNDSIIAAVSITQEMLEGLLNGGDLSFDDLNGILGLLSAGAGTAINSKGDGVKVNNNLILFGQTGIKSVGNEASEIKNNLLIATLANNATGMEVAGNGNKEVINDLIIITSGDNSTGMKIIGNENTLKNRGLLNLGVATIMATGNNAVGVSIAGNGNIIENSTTNLSISEMLKLVGSAVDLGDINIDELLGLIGGDSIRTGVHISGENSKGIKAYGSNNKINNSGFIEVKGNKGIGIEVEGNENTISLTSQKEEITIFGQKINTNKSFNVSGENSKGIFVKGNDNIVNSNGFIGVNGENSIGIDINGDKNIIELNNLISTKTQLGTTTKTDKSFNVTGKDAIGIKINGLSTANNNSGSTLTISGENSTGVLFENGGIFNNKGTLSVSGVNSTGVKVSGKSSSLNNTGTININDGTAIVVTNGGNAISTGTINLAKETDVVIKTEGEDSKGTISGTVKLGYSTKEFTSEQFDNLENLFQGENIVANGVVRDSQNNLVYIGGDHVQNLLTNGTIIGKYENNEYIIENLDMEGTEKGAIKFDKKAVVTGTIITGVVNDATDGLDYFLTVDNKEGALTVGENAVINAGKLGVSVIAGSILNFNGTINTISDTASKGNAFKLLGNSVLNASGATINGNIVGDSTVDTTGATVTLNKTMVDGNISLGSGDDELFITGGSIVTGNINLGAGDDLLSVDDLSDHLFAIGKILDGGTGDNRLEIGESNEVLVIKNEIKNLEIISDRSIFLDAGASITKNEITTLAGETGTAGNIALKGENYLVLGLKQEDGKINHAFTDISGNTISGDGTLYVDTREIKIDKNGTEIDLTGTSVEIEDLKATQFIYQVSLRENDAKFNGDILDITINTDVTSMGINSKYQDVWESIFSANQEINIENTTTIGEAKDLENLFAQIKSRNIYSLAMNQAYSGMKLYQEGIQNMETVAQTGEWVANATIVGDQKKIDGDIGADIQTMGALVSAEYGLNDKLSLGLNFGATKQKGEMEGISSDLESNSFYFGGYAKSKISKFDLLAGIGYQYNKFDGKNILDNGLDRFENSSNFANKGLGIYAQGKYNMELSKDILLQPFASASLSYLTQEQISEKGDMGITVKEEKATITDLKVGADLAKSFRTDSGKVIGKLSVAHSLAVGDLDNDLTASFNGTNRSDFKIDSISDNESKSEIGIGVGFYGDRGVSLEASYRYQFNSDVKNNKFTVGVGYKF